nr:hypothetical protein BaRGS_019179 [Batillaria attramentaria]
MEVHLKDVDAQSIEQIIEFCYTSTICVSEDNVWSLLPTATRLQMAELCTLCTDFLKSNLSPDTCMQTYATAVRCQLVELAGEAQKILKDNLEKVLESEGFLELSVDKVSEALQALPSSVLGHRDTVRAIRSWVQYKSDVRQCHAAQLALWFPGLISRLKEFLPEDLLNRPVEKDSPPPSPIDCTPKPSPYSTDYDPETNGLDLSMNGSVSRDGDDVSVSDSFTSDSLDTTPSPPLCLVCGEIFSSDDDLRQHKEDCTEMLFKESGEVLEHGFPSSPAESLDGKEEENGLSAKGKPEKKVDQHVCQLCYKVFSDKKSLGKHLRTHSHNGFSCSVCDKRYSTRSHLLGHMRLHSGTQTPFNCDYCRHPFSSYCALKVHMRGHKGARPFSCPTCGQHFAKNIHLKRHISTHTGIKPHECELCGKHFSRSDHLKRHIQSIHAGQRPHACHICKKAFVRKYELNKHLQLHARTGAMLTEAPWDGMPIYGYGNPSPTNLTFDKVKVDSTLKVKDVAVGGLF